MNLQLGGLWCLANSNERIILVFSYVVVQIRVGRVTGASVTLGIESQDNGNKYQESQDNEIAR